MSGYTDAELIAIEGWLKDGFSASQLAAAFAEKFRLVTRNAIIGVVHRNKVLKKVGFERSSRAGISNGHKRREKAQPPGPKRFPMKQSRIAGVLAAPAIKPRPIAKPVVVARHIPSRVVCREITLLELKKGDCRWPCNTPERGALHLFCGLPADPDRSYCAHHYQRSVGGGTPSERAAGPVLARAAA